ncbi:hypothetical protein [Dyadobacter sp. NIV53]|uniref:hypothetical protein n=1 Tax=Dyadobacter sp. NIV53 TaxID=2861765 RepID=UPI001C875ADD|nr:hypothetical protein [Dyadobacter sp. NIV53]
MAQELTFKSWQRPKLFDHISGNIAGRLTVNIPIVLTDTKTADSANGEPVITLMGATDVAGLKPGAIKHMAPAPFVRDAETTKLVHIDFFEASLPWRYTPEPLKDDQLRPWMVLLVGTAEEIKVAGGIANANDQVFREHNLAQSHLWAHVQHDGIKETGRILSPRGLKGKAGLLPQHQYVAVLVPAFNDEGKDMWNVTAAAVAGGEETVTRNFGKKGILPAFHFWQFMTAEAGDFETLAAALHKPAAADIGKARLYYRRNIEEDNVHVNEQLEIRGAITSLSEEPDQAASITTVRADLDILNDHIPDTIGLPEYGRPWLADPDEVAAGWPTDMNDDPRFRGLAGIGQWMGVEAQEDLMATAVKQAGALREAGQRINNMAFGLMGAGSLWTRHLPTDKNERLRILGPMMGRMLATEGGLVLDKVTAASPLAAAVFSSAAQRIIRDRSAQTKHITGANGSISRTEVLNAANQPQPLPERAPKGLPHIDAIAAEMGIKTPEELFDLDLKAISKIWQTVIEALNMLCQSYRRKRDDMRQAGLEQDIPVFRNDQANAMFNELSELLQTLLSANQMPCEGRMTIIKIGQSQPGGTDTFFQRVLEEDISKQLFIDLLWQELVACRAFMPCSALVANSDVPNRETFCNDMLATFLPPMIPDKKPVDLDKLSDLLFTVLDPRQADAPARRNLCARLTGVDCSRLIRPEFKVGIDFPTWDLLQKYDKEWLLPGVNGLEKDAVLGMKTNPAFIDAFMMGINAQFMSEMRWRDLAVDRSCTPLRMFWGQVNYTTGLRSADIQPFAEWAKVPGDNIGALSHQTIQPEDPGNTTGSRLVVVFRTSLFRRYPATLVYLVRDPEIDPDGEILNGLLKAVPILDQEEAKPHNAYYGPVFVGSITPEITFFIFDVNPEDVEKYWLVLDEPAAELRFRNNNAFDINDPLHLKKTSAAFAKIELDTPTRVARSGSLLKVDLP